MLKIWGRKNSNNVRKVLWCAEEIGLPYERIDAGGAFGQINEPPYRRLNPNGLVPAIEDGDFRLWESNTIVRYLAARYASGTLCPASPCDRALAERWMDWVTASLVTPFTPLFLGMVRTPAEKRDLPAIEAARLRCGELLGIVDQHLATSPYLGGDTFGMGDIPMGCFAYAWFEMPIERPNLPSLEDWYRRLTARQAYRTAVMSELT